MSIRILRGNPSNTPRVSGDSGKIVPEALSTELQVEKKLAAAQAQKGSAVTRVMQMSIAVLVICALSLFGFA